LHKTGPMQFHSVYQIVSLVMLATACSVALWRGGASERIAAAAMAAAWIATPFVESDGQQVGAQLGVLMVDIALLAVLLALALRSIRWWPMWAAAFHAVGALMHLLVAIDVQIDPRAYFVGLNAISYLTMGALLWGAARRARETRQAAA